MNLWPFSKPKTRLVNACAVAGEEPTRNERKVLARAEQHVRRYGKITTAQICEMGTSSGATKVILRLRKKGVLYPVGHPDGERWEPNRNGGRHKVYFLKRGGRQ